MEDPRIISTQFNSPKMPYYNVLVNKYSYFSLFSALSYHSYLTSLQLYKITLFSVTDNILIFHIHETSKAFLHSKFFPISKKKKGDSITNLPFL